MKRVLFLIPFVICSVVSAKTYYVAPTGGNNSYPGTISQPFAGLQKAISVAKAGDTVYIRGGTYLPTLSIDWIPSEGKGVSGTPTAPIRYLNYPGEKAVFDFKNCPPVGNYNGGFYLYAVNYIHLRGLTVRNVKQTRNYVECLGVYAYDCSNMKFENIVVHDVDGNAFRFFGAWRYPGTPPYRYPEHATFPGDSTFFINCDAYNCCDSLPRTSSGDPFLGGAADGYKTHNEPGAYMLFEGCRVWNCSDDGFDPSGNVYVEIKNCWAFSNGIMDGDGNGYKTGAVYNSTPVLRKITNSIAANNRAVGFMLLEYPDYLRTNARFYNNFSYNNDLGFSISNNANYPNPLVVYKNNVAYKTGIAVSQAYMTYQESNNTWNWVSDYPGCEEAFSLTDGDFVSLDVSQLSRARKADGSLPDVTFGHLSSNSPLINAGINVGLPYYGSAPDIGYAEYITGSVTPASPIFVSAVIQNATPSRLEMTYTLSLANTAPAPSTFTVMVNSVIRPVNSVTVSGTKVLLTLSTPVVAGDIVTVAYTKPASNPIQTPLGGQAASITAQIVVNNCFLTGNLPPVVEISSPLNNASYTSPATITITTTASDPDGSISKVEFFNGNTKLGEKNTAPYSYIWSNVIEGAYEISAIATDNENATNTSSVVRLKVNRFFNINSESINLYPNPNDGHFTVELLSELPFDNCSATILDLGSKRVYNGLFTSEQVTSDFNISNSGPGTYFFMITSGNMIVAVKKFVVQQSTIN